jgi:hypothetical protein
MVSMSIDVRQVASRGELKSWVELPYRLYRDHPYHVPQIISDELAYFDRRKNPAFEVSDVRLFLASDAGQVVGRLCCIVSTLETAKLGYKRGRFGWFECTDDPAVAERLLDSAADWFRSEGCTEMTGPQGFTDLDPEGLLIEGFDHLPTISGSYNHPYYQRLFEDYGLEKAVDYIEFRSLVPQDSVLFERMRKRLARDDNYRVVTCISRKEMLSHAGAVWEVLEAAFAHLYGVMPLTEKQKDFYTKKYFGFLDPEFVKLTFSKQGELVGFIIAIPNLSDGFRRARGRLLPLGFLHLLREYRKPTAVDFLLTGVKPGEPSGLVFGLNAVAMYDTLNQRGVRYMETNRELENNTTITGIWNKFERVFSRRSRVYRLALR